MAKAMRIRKDDQVIVIGGKDAGKTGRVMRTEPKQQRRLRRAPQHGQAPRAAALGQGRAARRRGRRDRREGGADPRLQRDAARPQRQQADPGRRAPRQRRQARALREAQRGVASDGGGDRDTQTQAAPPPRLRERYEQEVAAGADREVRLLDADAGAAPGEDHPQHGARRGEAERQDARSGAASSWRRSPASSRTSAAPASRSPPSRCARGCRSASRSTLRRARMWEFLDRLCSIAVPRIRDFRGLNPRSFDGRGNYSMGVKEQLIFPEIDYDSIDEVRGLDVTITTTARDRRGGLRAAAGAGHAVRPGGPSRRAVEDGGRGREEEQRKEEARLRAEAEQAALEQLKEENPEAYAKPEPEEGEEGEEGEGDEGDERRRPRARPTRRVQTMAKTSHEGSKQGRKAKFKTRGLQPLPPLRPAARLLPQVRPLPDLPARGRARGLRPRHDQVELVERRRC